MSEVRVNGAFRQVEQIEVTGLETSFRFKVLSALHEAGPSLRAGEEFAQNASYYEAALGLLLPSHARLEANSVHVDVTGLAVALMQRAVKDPQLTLAMASVLLSTHPSMRLRYVEPIDVEDEDEDAEPTWIEHKVPEPEP